MKKSDNLLIAIDLGNSAASYGMFEGGSITASGYAPSYDIPVIINKISRSGRLSNLTRVIISSVVPHLTITLVRTLNNKGVRHVYVVGRKPIVHIPMRYQKEVLGSDRLVNLYGAMRFYKPPILLIDFGTAITFDLISKKGVFEGGLIVPGLEISWGALLDHTALLPKIDMPFRTPKGVLIGRNTESAMELGLLNGFGALAEGLVSRFRAEYGKKMKVLATGGLSKKMSLYARSFDVVDQLHTVKSLAEIYWNEVDGGHRRKIRRKQ